MTEDEWLSCTDPGPMLEFLRVSGRASERELRLFAAACFGRLVALLPDPRQRWGIEVLERLAEGTVTPDECRGVAAKVRRAIPRDDPSDDRHYIALMLYREYCSKSIARHAIHASDGLAIERFEQVRLMRCVFGNPFRPVAFDAAWLDGTIPQIASAIYEERAFDRMPELGDVLEQSGCTDPNLLDHCRSLGDHVRGCWVVDAVLAKA